MIRIVLSIMRHSALCPRFVRNHDFYCLLCRSNDSQIALVTFKEPQALDTALLLSGATVVDRAVNITPLEDELPPSNNPIPREQAFENDGVVVLRSHDYLFSKNTAYKLFQFSNCFSLIFQGYGGSSSQTSNQAVDVVATMLARGFILGKDALSKAKEFDAKHDLSASAKSSVVNFDKNTGISEKLNAGTAVVNQQMKAVDEKYQVSEKTRAVLAVAEEKVSTAGSVLMNNRYLLTGARWVTGAFSRVQKVAAEVSQKTKEKAGIMESEHNIGNLHENVRAAAAPTYPSSERATLSPPFAIDSSGSQYPNFGYNHYAPLHSTEQRSTRDSSSRDLIL